MVRTSVSGSLYTLQDWRSGTQPCITIKSIHRHWPYRSRMKRQKAQGVGLYQNDVTKDINKASWIKTQKTIELNDKYRDYCKSNDNPMTFLEFKESLKPVRKKNPKPQKVETKKLSKVEQREKQKNLVEKRRVKREARKLRRMEKSKSVSEPQKIKN